MATQGDRLGNVVGFLGVEQVVPATTQSAGQRRLTAQHHRQQVDRRIPAHPARMIRRAGQDAPTITAEPMICSASPVECTQLPNL